METALIYCRVSTLHQNTERQLQELKEYCKRNDWKVIHEYSENISGTKSVKQRKHLIDVIGKHKPTHVVFHDYSRFSRNVKTALILCTYLWSKMTNKLHTITISPPTKVIIPVIFIFIISI